MSLEKAINEMYKGRENLIIIGLTGRTGSGCTTVAKILQKNKLEDLDLRDCKEYDYTNVDERKNKIVFEFMKEEERWKAFSVIEVSSIILASALELGEDAFINYINKITSEDKHKSVGIGEKSKVIDSLRQLTYMFEGCEGHSLKTLDVSKANEKIIKDYYEFYIKTMKRYKNSFRDIMDNFSCYEMHSDKMKGKHQSKYHLYTYLLQQMGNNIRSSGNPFENSFSEEQYRVFIENVDKVIQIVIRYDKMNCKDGEVNCSRICIDALRNPYEALYLKDKYRSFHLVSVNTDDADRKKRLKNLNTEELLNLDKVEYAQKMELPEEVFYHQNIQGCIECADIHVYNPDIEDGKYFTLTEQLVKYISLMLRPGLVTPTHVERCMQLAYNAKFNSGCLARQVGAVVTREDYSIQSVGWNDVPKGQVSCNLRDVHGYCKNRDAESFSRFEIEDKDFESAVTRIADVTKGKTSGRCMNYCFKDVYNGLKNEKNQVYTRALHAEENAFIQISKYGGTQVMNGCLFTTASPCELCAKKAYQLGIRKIYYIDPYPGISQSHILTFGKKNNPEMKLFFGAVGQAYLDFYEPRVPIKDELEMLTGVNIKEVVKNKQETENLKYEDIKYNRVTAEIKFVNDRNTIEATRCVKGKVCKDGIDCIKKTIIWTGSSFDGTQLIMKEDKNDVTEEGTKLVEVSQKMPYTYKIVFNTPKKIDDDIKYKIKTYAKDEKHVMEPYFAHMVKHDTQELVLKVIAPKDTIENVRKVVYADLEMKTRVKKDPFKEDEVKYELEVQSDPNSIKNVIYEYKIFGNTANINYTYAIEWDFSKE